MSEGSFCGAERPGGVDSLGAGEAFQEGFDLGTLEIVWEISQKKKNQPQKALLWAPLNQHLLQAGTGGAVLPGSAGL